MAGRIYRLPFNQLSLTASVQEIFALTASASIPLWLEEIRLDPLATSVSEFLLSLSLFTGSFTAGSGGASLTPVKYPNDAAAGATCKTANTTRTVVGSGTKLQQDAGQWNLVNGWAWQPIDVDHRIPVPASACLALSLDTAPGSTVTCNGCAIFREML